MSETKYETSRAARIFAAILTVVVIVCGITFFYKLFYFASTLWEGGSDMLGFAIIPVTNYLFVAAGFFMLLTWAFLNGQFKDIERAKYELLEDHKKYEAQDQRRRELERSRR